MPRSVDSTSVTSVNAAGARPSRHTAVLPSSYEHPDQLGVDAIGRTPWLDHQGPRRGRLALFSVTLAVPPCQVSANPMLGLLLAGAWATWRSAALRILSDGPGFVCSPMEGGSARPSDQLIARDRQDEACQPLPPGWRTSARAAPRLSESLLPARFHGPPSIGQTVT